MDFWWLRRQRVFFNIGTWVVFLIFYGAESAHDNFIPLS